MHGGMARWLFLVIALCATVAGAAAPKKSSAEQRVEKISRLLESSPNVPLSDTNFTRYTSDVRPYHAFVVFTALDAKYQCQICKRFQAAFLEAAEAYNEQHQFLTAAPDARLAFFTVDITSNRKAFQQLQLSSAPHAYLLPPLMQAPGKYDHIFEPEYSTPQHLLVGSSADIVKYLTQQTGIEMIVYQDPTRFLIVAAFAVVALAILGSWSARATSILDAMRSKYVYFIVGLAMFSVGVSGTVFCILKRPPWIGHGRQGVTIFSGGSRDQYGAEGYFVSNMSILGSLGLVLLYHAPKNKSYLLRHVLALAGLMTFVMMFFELMDAYQFKTGWYKTSTTFPTEFWSWVTAPVKTKSTFGKRAFRLAQYYIFEYTDFPTLVRKAKLLLFNIRQ